MPACRPGEPIWTPRPHSPEARALAHVARLATGGPADEVLDLTIQFHPDRLHQGEPLRPSTLR